MSAAWVPVLISASLTVLSTPLVRLALLRAGRLDVPNHRSSHTVPTPRGGGIACLIGVIGGVVAAQLVGLSVPHVALVACLAVAVVGLVDDQFALPALPRLLGQVGFGVIAGWGAGVPALGILGALLFPVVVNAINFMDGINGITGMIAFVWGLSAAYLGEQYGVGTLTVVGLVTAGAALGFLPFNAFRAKLFLGDVGSYLFGALCAAGILIGVAEGVPIVPLFAPLALYLVDVFLTLTRRMRAGQSLTTAHRDHIYQRLTTRGLEHFQVSAIVFALSALITSCWIFLPAAVSAVLTVAAIASYVFLPRFTSKSWHQ